MTPAGRQQYGDSTGSHNETARALRLLNGRLDALRGLAVLCRLAIVGNPHSLARAADEMECLAVDFPPGPLEDVDGQRERNEDEPDGRVMLAAAVDLFAGASFANKDCPACGRSIPCECGHEPHSGVRPFALQGQWSLSSSGPPRCKFG